MNFKRIPRGRCIAVDCSQFEEVWRAGEVRDGARKKDQGAALEDVNAYMLVNAYRLLVPEGKTRESDTQECHEFLRTKPD